MKSAVTPVEAAVQTTRVARELHATRVLFALVSLATAYVLREAAAEYDVSGATCVPPYTLVEAPHRSTYWPVCVSLGANGTAPLTTEPSYPNRASPTHKTLESTYMTHLVFGGFVLVCTLFSYDDVVGADAALEAARALEAGAGARAKAEP